MLPIVCFLLKQANLNSLSLHVAQEKMVYLLCKRWYEAMIFCCCHVQTVVSTTQTTILKRKICTYFNLLKLLKEPLKISSSSPLFKANTWITTKINNINLFSKLCIYIFHFLSRTSWLWNLRSCNIQQCLFITRNVIAVK